MGPILQEQTASTILKRVQVKDKVRVKNSENTGVVTSNKRGVKVNQNQKPLKKTSTLHKNILPIQDKEHLSRAETGQNGNRPKYVKSPTAAACKMLNTQDDADLRHPRSKPCFLEWEVDKQKVQPQSKCCSDQEGSHVAREKSRRALSLPLAAQPLLHPIPLQHRIPDLESLRLLEHKEDDTDSASDLSDSERLPVLPSPCTPPQLNLRAEVINTMDLHPHIPGPRTVQTESNSYGYPDFLPQPFNTWSLRQLAIFLNTEGKRAPRPKPVGQLEKYLERLLQLEWHQIQTIQAESGRPVAPIIRSRGRASTGPPVASHLRPHTAPPTRLSSPKSLHQSPRALPFALLSSLSSPSSSHLPLPVCPHCHVRYPLCNGSCSSYAYQRHSRLSPLLERKAPPTSTQKRSNSESRAPAGENRAAAKVQQPVKTQAGRSHQKCVQAAGNTSKGSQEHSSDSKGQPPARKGSAGRAAEVERPKDLPMGGKCMGVDKRIGVGNKREGGGKRGEKEGQRTEVGSGSVRAGAKRVASDGKGPSASRLNGKGKNGQCAK
ncbi:uncharacterized protein fam217ba [Brachyhypopomus gauderio]|uniref:uncharacterized protein fam217ba n=1 Tax=Brachyhypopomus gauderio TaxID=698409 RepID=UPI004041ECC7